MNWHLEATAATLEDAALEASYGADEDRELEPNPELLADAKSAAAALAARLGGNVLVTIDGHETTTGDGFRPSHVSVTTSKLAS